MAKLVTTIFVITKIIVNLHTKCVDLVFDKTYDTRYDFI